MKTKFLFFSGKKKTVIPQHGHHAMKYRSLRSLFSRVARNKNLSSILNSTPPARHSPCGLIRSLRIDGEPCFPSSALRRMKCRTQGRCLCKYHFLYLARFLNVIPNRRQIIFKICAARGNLVHLERH